MSDLVLLARLLEYPDDDGLLAHLPEAESLLREGSLSQRTSEGIASFLTWMRDTDSLVVQESYVEMVDRNRRGSLHLFEHIHGESRDRGGAMIDLQEFYAQRGAPLAEGELPDYLPVILEFAAGAPDREGKEFLAELAPVVARLVAEHARRGSLWAPVLEGVLEVCGGSLDDAHKVPVATDPEPDVDELWEEPLVEFAGDCAAPGGDAT
jgi:nitrate reductase delta subunit